jgi:hypothetical protein
VTHVCFVSADGGSAFMDELLDVVADEVRDLGADVSTHRGAYPLDDGTSAYVVVPHEYFVLTPADAHPGPDQLSRTIGFCVEHPGNATFETSAQWASQLGGVVDINRDGAAELQRRGIPAHRFVLGYARRWDHWRGDTDRPRPVNVTYMGTTDVRRNFVLGTQARGLCRWSARLLIPPHEQMTRPRPDFVMGAAKYEHLASSKVLLNLHRGGSRSLEWVRVLEAMCNGCVVVSEQSTDFEPLVPGTHLAFARSRATVAVAAALLANPDRLSELQLRAYEFCKEHLSMRASATRLLELAEALVTGVTPPVAPAVRPDTAAPSSPDVPEPRQPASGLPEAPPWMVGLPTEVRQQLAASSGRALLSADVRVTQQVLGADPDRVGLDAIISRGRSDAGLGITLRGLASQEPGTRALIGTSSVGDDELGVAHARSRNVLLAEVRTPNVLVIQTGQELLPGALRRLSDALEHDDAVAAAYGMMFDPASGSLWNALPFEPERVARRAYLHAPMLVRTAALEAIGGFNEDPYVIAYEDQDFWLRLAAAGLGAVLVPEIVGIGSPHATATFTPSTWAPEATIDALGLALSGATA